MVNISLILNIHINEVVLRECLPYGVQTFKRNVYSCTLQTHSNSHRAVRVNVLWLLKKTELLQVVLPKINLC